MRKLLIVTASINFPLELISSLYFPKIFLSNYEKFLPQDIFLPCQVFLRAPWCWSDSLWPTHPGSNLILALSTKTLGLDSFFRKYAQINQSRCTHFTERVIGHVCIKCVYWAKIGQIWGLSWSPYWKVKEGGESAEEFETTLPKLLRLSTWHFSESWHF